MSDVQVEYHWGKWVSSDTPVTGVISCNNVEWIHEEVDGGNSIDITDLDMTDNYVAEMTDTYRRENDLDDDWTPDAEQIDDWMQDFYDHGYGDSVGHQHLIGDWILGDDGKYDYDKSGVYSALVDYESNLIYVYWSKYVSRAALGSPCIAGMCDLDSDGDYLAYDLPPELYGELRENDSKIILLSDHLDQVTPDDL